MFEERNELAQYVDFWTTLEELKKRGGNKSERGTLFEEFCKKILLTAPFFADDIEKLWSWKDFPGNGGRHDDGIDIVVLNKNGTFNAVQCKFYNDDNTIKKTDIDSFISASTREFQYEGKTYTFSERLVFSTTEKVSINSTGLYTLFGPQKLFECGIDWQGFRLEELDDMKAQEKKKPKDHQKKAIVDVLKGFETNDRGRLIMACGTGKTYTALQIIEEYKKKFLPNKKIINILYLVPSIPLLSQTIIEWKTQISTSCLMYGICSDETAGKDRNKNRDDIQVEMPISATTDPKRINEIYKTSNKFNKNTLINLFFSTYQSIDVVKKVQDFCSIEFDIAVCDEAHRTIGSYKEEDPEISDFIKIHDSKFINAKKRLYMTATQKIYSTKAKSQAMDEGWNVYSMDDEKIYGPEFHYLSFGEAVTKQLLTDYRLLVFNVRKSQIVDLNLPQNTLGNLNDAAKIVGTLSALSKIHNEKDKIEFDNDPKPMKRAVAFCSTIASADATAQSFNQLKSDKCIGIDYLNNEGYVIPSAKLITGKNNTSEKNKLLNWLREDINDGECHILTNARCLSEGVDVPSLDSVIFLAKKQSQVDIIQAVGRVMRKFGSGSEKKYGYIIIPILINDEKLTDSSLSNNEDYKTVWQVVQALRSHDERLDTDINKIGVTGKLPANICVLNSFIKPIDRKNKIIGDIESEKREGFDTDDPNEEPNKKFYISLPSDEDLKNNEKLFGAHLVKHCGNRLYWEDWSQKIGDVTNNIAMKITKQIKENDKVANGFERFHKSLRKLLNPNISDIDCINMIAEHVVTLPVLKALFSNNDLIDKNPVVQIMERMVKRLKNFDVETEKLSDFYTEVRKTIEGIDSSEGRQEIIRKIFEKFFQYAFPKSAQKFGIVYTPVEIVDFIINSVSEVVSKEFGHKLSDNGVKILDPFTGTGTFIVRLLDKLKEELTDCDKFENKYKKDIWCNEIMLLAYYIALINIEDGFSRNSGNIKTFEHAVLTDTFQLAEKKSQKFYQTAIFEEEEFKAENAKAKEEDDEDIRIIIGNPPYSAGQKNASDRNQNDKYDYLDNRIAGTYLKDVDVTGKKSVYDSYVRAFRWASDRISENGIVSFVSNGSYVDNIAFFGFRRELIKEFNSIYVLNLRGNCRTSGEIRRKEGGNVFGEGSRTPICIITLVKKKDGKFDNCIHYYDIGDYLSRADKLKKIHNFSNINNIDWQIIKPDKNDDWINKKDSDFDRFIKIADKKEPDKCIFGEKYSLGISTAKDSWIYNFNKETVFNNCSKFINFYNKQLSDFSESIKKKSSLKPEDFVTYDDTKISWGEDIMSRFKRAEILKKDGEERICMYRPFVKKYMYYKQKIISRTFAVPNIFPEKNTKNLVIAIAYPPLKQEFSCLVTDVVCDYHFLGQTQMLPKQWKSENWFDGDNFIDGISDSYLKSFQTFYKDNSLKKDDIFAYIYALFHSNEYKAKYANNLSKEFPRVPFVNDCKKYIEIGKQLIDLHINYEHEEPYKGIKVEIMKEDYCVHKIRFDSKDKKDSIVFNDYIRISNIPLKCYEYKLNGRSPLEWFIDQYQVSTNESTKITDDPNMYSNNNKYIFNLLLSLISVSMKTLELIDQLPEYKELN